MQTHLLLLLFLLFAQGEFFGFMTGELEWRGDMVEGGNNRIEKCPKMISGLVGPRKLPRETWWTSLDACLAKLNEKHWNVTMGGAWKPEECVAQQRVAILTPHRLTDEDGVYIIVHEE
jgi:hypothetical protein